MQACRTMSSARRNTHAKKTFTNGEQYHLLFIFLFIVGGEKDPKNAFRLQRKWAALVSSPAASKGACLKSTSTASRTMLPARGVLSGIRNSDAKSAPVHRRTPQSCNPAGKQAQKVFYAVFHQAFAPALH